MERLQTSRNRARKGTSRWRIWYSYLNCYHHVNNTYRYRSAAIAAVTVSSCSLLLTMSTAQSEREPLLPQLEPHSDQNDGGKSTPVKATPLPKVQLLAVFTIKLLLPVASTQTAPYINLMVENLIGSENKDKVGYYSGTIVSFPDENRLNTS